MSLRLLLAGPLPPPSGGMANQTRQLAQLLRAEGVQVDVVQNNAPYAPRIVGKLWGLRALIRLLPYLFRLWRCARSADVAHVMANSGLAWYLFAAPAIHIARARGVPVIVNYRGGLAESFLARHARRVLWSLRKAQRVVVPSGFLKEIFGHHGIAVDVVPNIVNVEVFRVAPTRTNISPHIVVTRNLEAIYGIDVAIRAVALLVKSFPRLQLSIAGSGVERKKLEALVRELNLTTHVSFTGRLEVAAMVELYAQADVVLNPSRVDNTPNSILEALASGVPVVSTNVGGVPHLVEHGRHAWLVPADHPEKMAAGIVEVLSDHSLREHLRAQGLALAQTCSWPKVKEQWLTMYQTLARA